MDKFCETQGLIYYPDQLDRRKALWFVRDVLDVQVVQENAACLSFDGSFEDLRQCEAFLAEFPAVFLALADPEAVDAVADALAEYAPSVAVLKPDANAFRKHKNVREVLEAGGVRAVDHLLIGAVERPAAGLLDIADVEKPELLPTVLSGIRELDRATGGFAPGELSVWTGKRGGGKSTLLGQLLLDAVNQGHTACAYSGELSAWRFKQWISLQAAGPEHIVERTDRFSGRVFYSVPPAVMTLLDDWWRGRFLLYDNRVNDAGNADGLLRIFEYAIRKHGACVFLVDNLMTANFASNDRDFYRAQSEFVGRLEAFAVKHEVHIHLVAHPRKTDGKRQTLEADDIGGSGDVTNKADNVFALTRLDPDSAAKHGCQTVLQILKNRQYGELISVGLDFEPASRRFFKSGSGSPGWRYGWEQQGTQEFVELPEDTETPFDRQNGGSRMS